MKRRTVLLACLLSICLLSSASFFVVLIQKITCENQHEELTMNSGSMEPTLNVGDILVIDKHTDPAPIIAAPKDAEVPGDILAYYDARYGKDPNHVIVHRAVEKFQDERGTWYFYTKGDASLGSSYDPWSPIGEDHIIGKVVDVNPFLSFSFSTAFGVVAVSHWNMWLLILLAAAIVTGLASLPVFLLSPSRKQQASTAPPPPEKKPVMTAGLQATGVHCIYCGEKLPSYAVHCRKCGKKVE